MIYQEVCNKRKDTKWFHRYVSEHLVRDFENGSEAFLLRQLINAQNERDKLIQEYEKRINELAQTYQEAKTKRQQEEIKKEFERETKIIGVRE